MDLFITLAIILGVVAAITALSSLVFLSRPLKARYQHAAKQDAQTTSKLIP